VPTVVFYASTPTVNRRLAPR